MKTARTSSKHIPPAVLVAFVGVVVIVLLMAGCDSATSATTATIAASTPIATSQPADISAPEIATSAPADTYEPIRSGKSKLKEAKPYDTSALMWQMLAAILVILVLGVLTYVVVKKVLPKIGQTGGKRISLLETVYIQPRKALHLIQVGSRKYLIASSPEGLVKLDDVTDAIGLDYAETASKIEDEAKDAAK